MATTFRAIFDGEVLRPTEPTDLRLNEEYVITAEPDEETEVALDETYPLTRIAKLAVDAGVDDMAANHNKYAHQLHTRDNRG